VTGDGPARAVDVELTATQKQRLRELGAAEGVVEERYASTAERDDAFRRSELALIGTGRQTLDALRQGSRVPMLRRLEQALREALTAAGFCEVVTPLIVSSEALDKMGIAAGDPLREQVYWVERDRALRPMLAPNLYTLLRRLGRLWPRPFGIFEVGSCFRRDTKGSRHLSEFTMLNCVELGTPLEDRDRRLRDVAALAMAAAGIDDYELQATDSEVYGETLDVIAAGIEVCSTAVGPLPLDDAWGITEPWVGLGFGLERLLLAREGYPNIERVGRSITYFEGVRLNI
jgi:pyrrolysyl-tRNA synthetase-like protein